MPTQRYILRNMTGLHARPAAHFAKAAAAFACAVRVQKGAKVVNGKSVLALLALGAKHNDTLVIETEGEQADEALLCLGGIVSQTLAE